MTPDAVGPLSRPFPVDRLPAEGQEIRVVAKPEECAALARDFKLEALHRLEARFRLSGSRRRLAVKGRLTASITQVCVVSLEPFDSEIDEAIEVEFTMPARAESGHRAAEIDVDADAPDEIVDGIIDLGALTAEFLALGLDPHPRKPGVEFALEKAAVAPPESPFAALKKLVPKE